MTQEQAARSVSIAEDVLKHLHDWRLGSGVFLSPNGDDLYAVNMAGGDITGHIDETRKTCDVCALGACFVSMLDVTGAPYVLTPTEARFGVEFHDLSPRVSDALGTRNMTLIEVAYELGKGWYENYDWEVDLEAVTRDEYDDAITFGQCFPTKRVRLQAIMQNIVGNRGAFQPGEVAIA